MGCKLLQKRFTGKTKECSKHLHHIAIEKNILSELNRCIFQIPLKFIKLVIPKILFILVLCSFNFYFKITRPPPTPPPPKLNFLTPSSPCMLEGRRCIPCPESSIKTKSLNTKPCLAGLSPRIICQPSPFLPKMPQNCCTH